MLAPALTTLLALSPLAAKHHNAAPPPAEVAVEFVVDVSAGMTKPEPRIPMLLEKLREVIRLTGRRDSRIAVRGYGGMKPAGDCTDTTLLQPFGPPGAADFVSKIDPIRDFGAAPLARAIEEAGADLAREQAPRKLLVIVAAGPDGCGADACAAVEGLLKRGLRQPRVIHVANETDAAAGEGALACLGSITRASTRSELVQAFADALADAAPRTGVQVSHWSGAASAEPSRFSVRPLTGRERSGLLTQRGKAAEFYSLPHGSYEVTVDAPGVSPVRVHVSQGQLATIATGEGSLLVRTLNFWGAEISAPIVIAPAGYPGALAAPTPVPAPATTKPQVGDARQPRAKNSTLPMPAGSIGAPAAAAGPDQPKPEPPKVRSGATQGLAAVSGAPIDLPAGRYDITVRSAGGGSVARDIVVEAGSLAEVYLRFGGMRVEGRSTPSLIRPASGGGTATIISGNGATVHLTPGRYEVRSRDGSELLAEDVEVRAGDVTVVTLSEGR